ncbi:UBX domain-containing protein [Actinidia chinensis var. chinensis]|uniref:UBX domain-containing protein n=1 Tax=Actinidia chinensis var. chinensis TaxID=1590841 RepID=A0A2R6QHK4_ACTCC|nr:UBX domain-containing protein [Actinidia chinensis var. chinensis]
MTNEINQLPSSPLEEYPPRDEPSDHGRSGEIDNRTRSKREFNIMTQGDLDRLIESYSFLLGIQAKIPEEGETILFNHLGELAFYKAAFHAGLRLPIHPTIKRILNFYNICPIQLSPNAWQSVACVLVVWPYYKVALCFGDSGWLYFKARSGRTMVKGSPSNVKGWKRSSSSYWGTTKNFLRAYLGEEGVPRVPRSWNTPRKCCNELPILTDLEDWRSRRVFRKLRLRGFFKVSVVLNSKTFERCFALNRERMVSSGGDNAEDKSADGIDDVAEYIGTIRRRERRVLPRLLDQVLLSILGAKIHPSFLYWEPGSSSSSSSSRAMSESWLPSELRSDDTIFILIHVCLPFSCFYVGVCFVGMSKRISLKNLDQKVKESKGASSSAKPIPIAKGVVIREKHPRDEVLDILPSKTGSKGKESMPPFETKKKATSVMTPSVKMSEKVTRLVVPGEGILANPGTILGPKASVLGSPSMDEKILGGVIPPTNKEKVDKPTLDQAVSLDGEMFRAEKLTSELEEQLAEVRFREQQAVEELKKEIVKAATSKYFSEGFDFCKRQIARHHPDLGLDLEGMGLDHDLLE